MSRDSNGNYTLPNAAFVNGTVISSSVMNSNFSNISSEITNSLDRSGRGGMLSYLRGVNGSSALPAYSYTSETTLGMYRVSSGVLGVSSNGTDFQRWSTTEVRVYQAFVAEKGATITNSTTNGAGITVTGNGTAAGGVFTGGSSAGRGLTVTGGAGGTGAVITGGSGNTVGLSVAGIGSGTGAVISGGTTGWGVNATGTIGIVATGTNGGGVTGIGSAGEAGAKFIAGTAASAAVARTSIYSEAGYLTFTGASAGAAVNPNKDVSFTNTLTPKHFAKVWGNFTTDGTGGVTVNDGVNIASASISGTDLVVTIAGDFANSAYAVVGGAFNSVQDIRAINKATGTTTLRAITPSTAATYDLSAAVLTFDVIWFGAQ
jgi:hypothetical protein